MAGLTKAQLSAFAQAVLRNLWEGYDMDGSDIQEAGLKYGLIKRVGFDPEKHTDGLGVCPDPGDDWFVEHKSLAKFAGRAALKQDGEAS
jgi:hypothetical protein